MNRTGLVPVKVNTTFVDDLTSQIDDKLESPVARGSFGQVYRRTIETSRGRVEVAVKVFVVDHPRPMGKMKKKNVSGTQGVA